jgi:hypothetical protein
MSGGAPPPFGGGTTPGSGPVPGTGPITAGPIPCKEATEALIYAIIGLFCCGIILGPIAIFKALNAKKLIQANPQLTGSGKATAALIIGILGVIGWVVSIIERLIIMSRH